MWKTVAKEEKRVKDLLENAKRRAQRRRAYYDSKLGDPLQLLRVSGTGVRLETNPETYTFNEDAKSLMPWASDPSVKIDRFDGRALLDFLPSTTTAMIESGLRLDRDEDGIGNELRFQRWHDLIDKARLHLSEDLCLVENEEEWNDLVAKHHVLIGKLPEKHKDAADTPSTSLSFAHNYGTEVVQGETELGQHVDPELTALEEDNILDHLDDLSVRDRDYLDSLGAEYHVQDYYRMLRNAKEDQDTRVMQLKVTAVNLERALAGKKPLKASEIEGLIGNAGNEKSDRESSSRRRRRRGRSSSPAYRGTRRSSPSYEPYRESSSRSGSESPKKDNMEFIMEFEGESAGGDEESWMEMEHSSPQGGNDSAKSRSVVTKTGAAPQQSHLPQTSERSSHLSGTAASKMSLTERLKQRMRQGMDQSVRSSEAKPAESDTSTHSGSTVPSAPQQHERSSRSHRRSRSRGHSRTRGRSRSKSPAKSRSSGHSERRRRSRSSSRSGRHRHRSISPGRNRHSNVSRERTRRRSRSDSRRRSRSRQRHRPRYGSRSRSRSRSPRQSRTKDRFR